MARLLSLGGVALLAAAIGAVPAQASLGGVSMSAQGFGVQWTFNQPGSPIPAEPTGEMEQAYSLAEYNSGPNTHGLASLLWPGSAGANFGPVYGFPAYPVRAEGFSPGTPHGSKNDYGPNTSMRAKAGPSSATASTVWQDEQQAKQGVATGDFATSALSIVHGDSAISLATAQVSDLTIGGGVVHVDSVITRGRAVTNGKNGRVSGGTKVLGVTVGGQSVTVDDKGVHAGGQTAPVLDPINNGTVQQTLDQAGITLKVAKPVDSVKGADAQRALGGLVVTFESGALNAVVDKLPQQVQDQLRNYIQFDQTVTLEIGAVTVGSQTIGGFSFAPPPVPPPPPPGAPTGVTVPAVSGGGGTTTTTTTAGSPAGGAGQVKFPKSNGSGGGPVATVPVGLPLHVPPMKSVPVLLTALALAAAAGSGRFLKNLAQRALAGRAGERCPLEGK